MTLLPQVFPTGAVTILPNLDFFALSKTILPQIYQNAPNFMAIIFSIATIKQYMYDIIQSLCNVYNLYSSRSVNSTIATPQGVYLRMLATDIDASFSDTDTDSQVKTAILKKINFVVSRGTAKAFYDYFERNGLSGLFSNRTVQESQNATLFFNVPVPDNPLATPNPFSVFLQGMQRLKAAGIKVTSTSAIDVPYFQLANLAGVVGPNNAGFAGLNFYGQPVAGGHYRSN